MSNTVKLPACPKCGLPIAKEAPQGLCPKCVLLGAATATEQGVPATATSEIPSIERISKAFPQLEILELIGRGGMGFVFKARQPHLDRFVALKLLPDKLAKDAQFAERFNREGRVLAKLNHPNIVSVFDFGQTGGFYYLTMEYVDGVNLRQAMRAGRFSPAEALSIVPKVCEALQYAHEQGILHRDIKPENILLDAKGRVKIADFGIAKLVGEVQPNITLTNTGAALGTPHYMAPEQLEKPATVDHRADIYSLGVVFYEMLTGELPIGRFAAPSSKTPVNTTVDDVVFRTLEKDRELRFQSAGEMRTQVEHLGAGANAAPTQTGSTEARPGEKRRLSEWSIYGALGVGLSLPMPLMAIVTLLTGRGEVGPGELWLALGSVALPGLGGTVLGWLGLNEIRESGGRVRGLPLALFATLFWPLTLIGALAVGVPMSRLVSGGTLALNNMVGRFLVLLLPASMIAFSFAAIHATSRWANRKPTTHQRPSLKWVVIIVLMGWLPLALMVRPERSLSRRTPTPTVLSPEAATKGTEGGEFPRKLLFRIPNLENDAYQSLMVTTDSELPVGDYLVGLLQRPDGRIEEHPASVTVYSGAGRDREMRHVLWSMGEFGSNRVREFATNMRVSLDGRVVEVTSDQRVPIFSVTNDRGGTVAGFLALRSHRLPDTGSPSVFVSIIDTPQQWVSFLSVKLRVSAPPGYMPLAVGVLADGSELETHTSISGGGREDAGCYWYLPREFAAGDVQEIIRQLVATKVTSPNGIEVPNDRRAPVFSVTNQTGTIFRGYFEIKKSAARPSSSAPVKSATATTATKAPANPTEASGLPRKVQFRTYENDKYQSLSLTSDSELPAGEYLVGLWQRPDGRIEERPATTTIYGGGGPTRMHKHLLWSMSQFNSNRVREFAADLKSAMDGRVIELLPDQKVPVFSVTNDQGGTVSGFVALRSHALPATDEPAATITVTEASVASQFFLSASLRITAPPGYLPNAVGLMGDGSELNTHTSIFGGRMVGASARDSCYWYYPKNFQTSDVQEIVRQILAIKVTHPNGIKIRPGERVPVFAVTNQAGTIFRGFFELPPLNVTK